MFTKLLVSAMPLVPGPIMRRLAGRYIAGEELEDALRKLAELRAQGFTGIFDILGEGSNTEAHARTAAAAYARGADALSEAGLDAYISIKPSHLGLKPGVEEELPFQLYSELATRCAAQGRLVRVEMEDHPTTDATLRLFARLRARFDNVGLVLQSRLFRTPDDIDALPAGPLDIRLVKGIYLEPAEIAHTEPRAISDAFVSQTRQLLQRGDVHLRFATHDDALAERLVALVREFRVPRERYEFQVLLGVQEHLWTRWRDGGHPVRVYVPFGPEWRSYSQRRLRKNPKLAAAVIRDLIGIGK
ncbi:MAG: proline dehydrogenase family protein [Planctomycetes bacterium]|nr:proline dehydrogenase family protein [Planctomycetota bacterium]